jgi:hypothetical protein
MPRHKTAHRKRLEEHHKAVTDERATAVKELKQSGTLKPYATEPAKK